MANSTEEIIDLQKRIEHTADGLVAADPIGLRDLALEAAQVLSQLTGPWTMHLLIDEAEEESFYPAHGHPLSVHWTEEEANRAADDLRQHYPEARLTILPVPLGAKP